MSDTETGLTLKQAIAEETKKLVAKGVPEFLASIQAAGTVAAQRHEVELARGDAMASSCNEA